MVADAAVTQVPFFMSGAAGEIFAICHMPAGAEARSGILFFPPFAEEMNKSRRMVTLTARRLAALGCAVLIVDPFGTGDSQGDFAEARWPVWRDDMIAAVRWLEERGIARVSFWALRTGALLAADTAASLGRALDRLVLWAPVTRGELFVSQFLRLKVASGMLSGEGGLTTKEMRAGLATGEALEVAGYDLSPGLVSTMEGLRLQDLAPKAFRHVHWFEIAAESGREAGPAVTRIVDAWRSAATVSLASVTGDLFWGTTEIAVVPDLVDATAAVFAEEAAPA